MHGDMGPWNLRHLDGFGAILFDWELARRGPPGADVAFHLAASRAMRIRTDTDLRGLDEAASFWMEEIPRRFAASASDQSLAESMLSELRMLS
jgi:aminoglycoside phosphotransferase (APT) family kinase protein